MKLAPWFALLALFTAGSASAGTTRLTTEDKVSVHAETAGSGDIGVILVHDEGGSSDDLKTLSEKLAGQGVATLRLDLRGHGKTGGDLAEEDYPKMVADVHAAVAYLKKQGKKEIMVIGAGLGANVALNAAGNSADVNSVVLLSPGLNIHGLKVSSALSAYGDRAMLVTASSGDVAGSRAASALHQSAKGPKHLELYDGTGKGSKMLNTAPDLENLIISWVKGTFLQSKDPSAAREAGIKTDVEEVETTGTKLEDQAR